MRDANLLSVLSVVSECLETGIINSFVINTMKRNNAVKRLALAFGIREGEVSNLRELLF
jgi:hypothetical protein